MNDDRRWLRTLMLIAACASTATGTALADALDDVLRTAVAKKRVPGVVAIVANAERVEYRRALGMKGDGIFAIASMTMPVTSVAVMQLVEAGKVKLDEPASTYLPELAQVKVLEKGVLRSPKSPITVRHLLTHTSGYGYEFFNRELFEYVAAGKLSSAMAGDDGFLKAPLIFDPGTRWEYGISTDWLGRLVERVSGRTLEAYLRQAVFDPLGMSDTYFNVPAGKHARLMGGFVRGQDGALAAIPREPFQDVEFFSGGGGLYSTPDDYSKLACAILGNGRLGEARILTADSVEQMARNQIGELTVRPMRSMVLQFAKDRAVMPGRPDKFGLGFAMNAAPIENGRGANALSWAGLFNTFFWIDRDKKVCAVLFTQMLPFLEDGPRALMEEFERAVYARKR
jgi:CubicO group peptidase (beta-lactamase class C family)